LLRAVALEDLTAMDVDPATVAATRRTRRVDAWPVQPPAPINCRLRAPY
jgi:hypothetical protein